MKKKYTIFGHSGFLGKNIVDYLKKKKLKYFLPPRNRYIFRKNLNNIIYCIGTDDILKDPIKTVESNLGVLCKVIEKNSFKSFLFVSSTRVYYGNKKTSETSKILVDTNNPTYLFNLLKLSSENFCLAKKNKNIKVVRLTNLYGKNFSNQIYLLPTLLREAERKKKIFIKINKNSKKNYIDINDAILIMLKIIGKSKYRLYNLASDQLYSLNYIANNIKSRTKCKIIYQNQKIKYNEPKIDISRIKKEFKFIPKKKFQKFFIK